MDGTEHFVGDKLYLLRLVIGNGVLWYRSTVVYHTGIALSGEGWVG